MQSPIKEASLSSMKFPMIAYGVLAIIILIVPLLMVTPVLIDVRGKALREYGALVTIHNQLFDRKWIQKEQPEDVVILGNQDASSLIDLGSSLVGNKFQSITTTAKALRSFIRTPGVPTMP